MNNLDEHTSSCTNKQSSHRFTGGGNGGSNDSVVSAINEHVVDEVFSMVGASEQESRASTHFTSQHVPLLVVGEVQSITPYTL